MEIGGSGGRVQGAGFRGPDNVAPLHRIRHLGPCILKQEAGIMINLINLVRIRGRAAVAGESGGDDTGCRVTPRVGGAFFVAQRVCIYVCV